MRTGTTTMASEQRRPRSPAVRRCHQDARGDPVGIRQAPYQTGMDVRERREGIEGPEHADHRRNVQVVAGKRISQGDKRRLVHRKWNRADVERVLMQYPSDGEDAKGSNAVLVPTCTERARMNFRRPATLAVDNSTSAVQPNQKGDKPRTNSKVDAEKASTTMRPFGGASRCSRTRIIPMRTRRCAEASSSPLGIDDAGEIHHHRGGGDDDAGDQQPILRPNIRRGHRECDEQ